MAENLTGNGRIMNKGKTFLRKTGIVFSAVFAVMLAWSLGARGVQPSTDIAEKPRADIITIDVVKSFGDLERPPVVYLHEKHSDAVEKQNKDCSVCHLTEESRQSIKFKRLKDTTKKQIMDLYHAECIDCHNQTAAANQKSGPVTCGQCHRKENSVASSWEPIGMNKSLHYRHSKAMEDKCERCHHEYNEGTKALFYAKGKEGTCRYCHKPVSEENRISMRLASHQGCVDCHLKQLAQNKDAGPVKCGSCHDPVEKKLIKVVEDVPRMKRNQPDVVFVRKTPKAATDGNPQPADYPSLVPFNHKGHEGYNDPCRVCDKPVLWNYYQDVFRKKLYKTFAALIKLRRSVPAFSSPGATVEISVSAAMKRIRIADPSMNVIIIGNFDVVDGVINPGFYYSGNWYDYFTGTARNITDQNAEISLQPGEFHIYTDKPLPVPEDDILNQIESESRQLLHFELAQNYPNPFNPLTTIKYELAETSHVYIRVFDILGREIVELVNARKIPGRYEVKWDGKNSAGISVSSGVFICKIEVLTNGRKTYQQSRKMILIR